MSKAAASPSSSSSSCSWRKSNKTLMVDNEYDHIHVITESEMEAAQQLMELSDEDNNNKNNYIEGKKRKSGSWDEEDVEQRVSSDDIIMAKIKEIFGNDVQVFRPKKQRRYRSLVNIYMATRPLNAGNGTRMRETEKRIWR